MLKKSTFSPAQPRRAKTRRSTGKAATDESAGGVAFSPAHPKLLRQLVLQVGYVEDAFEARTTLADFFSFLLEGILCAAKACAAGAAVHRAPVSIARAKTDCRLEPGSAAHRFDRPARRALRV